MQQFTRFVWGSRARLRLQVQIASGLLTFCLLVAPAGASISGVCPDGSIFIVQAESSIPCRDAKRVAPTDIPPLNPEMLPRPYGWERFHDRQDPHNPYNVVDSIDLRPPGGAAPPAREPISRLVARDPATERRAMTPPNPSRRRGEAPALSPQELADLAQIIELAQRRAPATFVQNDGSSVLLRIAHSKALEMRLREMWQRPDGLPEGSPVVFSAAASHADDFYANLTFVQDSVAFHPNRDDTRELGVLQGSLGQLGADETVLGYAWLPTSIDLRRSVDVYWNDRVLSATLDPS